MNSPTSEVNSPDVAVLSELIRRQSATSADLTGCKTFADIARVVARHMLDKKQFVTVSAFILDGDGDFAGYRTFASANREETFDGIHELAVPKDEVTDELRAIVNERRVTVLDMDTFVAENPAFKVWKDNFHLKAMLLMPLVRDDAVYGHIVINSLEHFPALSSVALDIYSALANQISLIIYANKLLEDSQQAQSTASQLVHANRLISTSSTHAEMLQAIMSVMPEQVTYVALVRFDKILRDGETPSKVYMEAFITRPDEIDFPDIEDQLTTEESAKLGEIIKQLRSGAPLRNTNIDVLRDKYALVNHVNFFKEQNADEVTSVGLYIGKHLHGLIVYGMNTTNQPEINNENLLIIADQVAIVLENRRLLDSAANTLNETQLLYHINRELLLSKSGLDLLRVLKSNLAQNARSLSLVSVEWNTATKEVVSVVLQDIIDADGERSPERVLVTRSTPGMIEKYKEEWALQGDEIDFIDDAVKIAEDRPAVKNSLAGGIYASIVIPIREEDRLIQQIFITFSEKQDFNESTRRLYQAIQDQVRLVVQNRLLLRRLEGTLNETQNLYSTIQPLMQAESNLEVLKALYTTVAEDANYLAIVHFEWDEVKHDQLASMILEAHIDTETGENETQADVLGFLSEQERLAYEKELGDLTETIEFAEDLEPMMESRPGLIGLYRRGVRSGIFMPIFEDDVLRQMLTIGFNEAQEFSNSDRRLFTSLYTQLKIILQNRRLVRDTQIVAAQLGNQVRVMGSLNQLASTLPLATTEGQLAGMVCEALAQALPIDHVSFWLNADDPSMTRLVGEEPPLINRPIEMPRNMKLKSLTTLESRPVVLEDLEIGELVTERMHAFYKQHNVHSVALTAIQERRAGYIGIIQICLIEPNKSFTESMLDIFQTMTNQTSVTLQNILLLRNTQRQAQQLQQIANFAQLIQTTFDTREILEITLHNAHDLLKFDAFNVLLYSPENASMSVVAQQAKDEQTINIQDGTPISLEGTFAGEVWNKQQTLLITDVAEWNHLHHSFNEDVKSLIAVPLYLRGTIQGVVEVGKVLRNGFSSTDIAIFQQLTSQLAVALESADAYTQNQRLARSKAQVNEITNSLQRQTELDRIMTVTARELGKALGAKRARIRLGNPTDKDNTE